MRRQVSRCDICAIDFVFAEQHEDHDDSDRHYQVWYHYNYKKDENFCELCAKVKGDVERHDNAKRHIKNLQRLAILQVPDVTILTSGGVVAERPPSSGSETFMPDVTILTSGSVVAKHPPDSESKTFMPMVAAPHSSSYEWIADTGATRSATFSDRGLYNETVCRVRVKGVGGEFVVTRTGLLDVKVLLDNGTASPFRCWCTKIFPFSCCRCAI